MWRRTDVRTDVRTKSGKPHVGRPLLGPAIIIVLIYFFLYLYDYCYLRLKKKNHQQIYLVFISWEVLVLIITSRMAVILEVDIWEANEEEGIYIMYAMLLNNSYEYLLLFSLLNLYYKKPM